MERSAHPQLSRGLDRSPNAVGAALCIVEALGQVEAAHEALIDALKVVRALDPAAATVIDQLIGPPAETAVDESMAFGPWLVRESPEGEVSVEKVPESPRTARGA